MTSRRTEGRVAHADAHGELHEALPEQQREGRPDDVHLAGVVRARAGDGVSLLPQRVEHVLGCFGIEVARGLIREQHPRRIGDRACDRHLAEGFDA